MNPAMKISVVSFFAICAVAQANFWSSFLKSPLRHFGLEPSSEIPKSTFKSEFLGSASKTSQTVAVDSDLYVKARSDNFTIDATVKQLNATVTPPNKSATVVSATPVEKKLMREETAPATPVEKTGLKLMREETAPATPVEKTGLKLMREETAPEKTSPKLVREEAAPTTTSPERTSADEKVKSSTDRSEASARKAERSFEGNLIHSLRFMGDNGEEAVDCVTHCRYGEVVRHEWRECLEKCVENKLMRSTFMSMLPQEKHDAHETHIEMPDVLKKRQKHKSQKSEEL
jgi:hypothetical protein